jgi:hypothetical protein
MKGEAGDRIRKNPLGLGLLLGGAVFSHGRSCGCRKAEILAINDDGECEMHLHCFPFVYLIQLSLALSVE